jgi:galactonate dehydratase
MKVTKIEPIICNGGKRNWLFVEVTTDEGIVGYGDGTEWWGTPVMAKCIEDLAPFVIDENPFNTQRIWQKMYIGSYVGGKNVNIAMTAIETALWDIVGKAVGKPLYDLLGGKCRDRIRLYSHAYPYARGEAPRTREALVERTKELLDAGFKFIKTSIDESMPIGVDRWMDIESISKTAEIVRLLRETVRNNVELCIDVSNQLDLPSAIRLGRALEPYNLAWFEDPIKQEESPESYKRLREAIRTPVGTGENLYNIWSFRNIIENNGVDIILPDFVHAGGIMQGLKIAALAEAYHLPVAPHNPNSPLSTIISAHICAVIPNFVALEFTWPDVHWRDKVISEPLKVKDGYLELPTGPGLGVDLVKEEIIKHPYEEKRDFKAYPFHG